MNAFSRNIQKVCFENPNLQTNVDSSQQQNNDAFSGKQMCATLAVLLCLCGLKKEE